VKARALVPLVLVALALSSPSGADDWAQQGGAARRDGRTAERVAPPGPAGLAAAAWSAGVGEQVRAGPVVADGVVVAGSTDGRVRGLAEDDGRVLWTVDLGGQDLIATPAAGSGRVVVAAGDGRVVCLAVETGEVLWSREELGGPRAAVALQGDAVVVSLGFPDRALLCLDLLSGELRWRVELDHIGYSPPAIDGDLVVVGMNDGTFQGRRLSDGALGWTFATTGRVWLSGASITPDHVLLLPGGDDPSLYCLDRDTGALVWSLALADTVTESNVSGVALSGSTPAWTGSLVVAVIRFEYSFDDDADFVEDRFLARAHVMAVDPTSPSTVAWRATLGEVEGPTQEVIPPFGVSPQPVVLEDGVDTWVAVARLDGPQVEVFRQDGAPVATCPVGGAAGVPVTPALADGRLLVVTSDGDVEARALGGNAAPAMRRLLVDGVALDHARPTLAWESASDPDGDPLTYEVRLDDDGEVLLDALVAASGVTALTLDVGQDLASDRTYTWQVRARDPDGASSPWSVAAAFQVSLTPGPPRAVRATGGQDFIDLTWTPSLSDFVDGYPIEARQAGQAAFTSFGAADADATSFRLTGLVENAEYEVRLRARSALGKESAPETVVLRTGDPVLVDGQPVATLHEGFVLAGPGAVITLGPGEFVLSGGHTFAGGITLRGAGAHRTRLLIPPGSPGLTLGVGRSEIGALAIVGAGPASGSPRRGLVLDDGELELDHVVLARLDDGLVVGPGGSVDAEHVTIAHNGRGVVVDGGDLRLVSSVVSRNGRGVERAGGGVVEASYSAVLLNVMDRDWEGGGAPPAGLLPAVAVFRDESLDDYREAPSSPTIDAGDPQTPVGDEPAPHGDRVNLGAFGGTTEATPTPLFASRSGGGGCALASAGAPRAPTGLLLLLGLAVLVGARGRTSPTRSS
jgi:outer membrane protein assembly factor BamB